MTPDLVRGKLPDLVRGKLPDLVRGKLPELVRGRLSPTSTLRIEALRGLNSGDIWRYPAFDSH